MQSALFLSVLLFVSCSKDRDPVPEGRVDGRKGVFVLNQGASEKNNASLSFIDLTTNQVTGDLFSDVNGYALGDVANDMKVYGSLLFVLVDQSNKVDILDAETAEVIKTLPITSPRQVAFHSGKAFITSLTNKVFVLDTLSKTFVKEIPVGRSPEQIVASGNRLYVANSGWADVLSGGEYDNRLFVINPTDYSTESPIVVSDNLTHVFADGKGTVYAGTSDIFDPTDWNIIEKPSRLYKINTATRAMEELDFGANFMAFSQNMAYMMSYNYEPGKESLLEMDLLSGNVKEMEQFKSEDFSFIIGLQVNPDNGDIWLGTTDYVNPGKVFRYAEQGGKVSSYTVGLNPANFVFTK